MDFDNIIIFLLHLKNATRRTGRQTLAERKLSTEK
jgi:hypothetical protein